jgi:hypothetical protein
MNSRSVWIGAAAGAAVAVGAALALLAVAPSKAQVSINADGCTCSRPTVNGMGRDQITTYHCVCPGTQCVITATQSTPTMPPNVVQTCR